MLEVLNRYSHGLTSVPILVALRERGCLARLAGTVAITAEEMADEFSANRGYLDVALRMMVCLEWLRPIADGRYEPTPGLASVGVLPARIMELYRFPFDRYVRGDGRESLEPWLEQSERRWSSEHPFLPDYLDGLLIIPLLLSLRAQGRLSVDDETLRLEVDPTVQRQIERLFVAKRWAARSGDVLRVNRAGRFVIERIFITATVASYMPMFARADELLFGDAARVFERDAEGHETHVDRTVNVIGSGFQHEKFFTALTDLVIRCFDGEDYASQPKYIVDMGCGDGTLLRRLYEAVRDRTCRGKVLDAHPVIPVAVDFNERALAEASRTLVGIEHIAVRGDIGDPATLVETLRANGVEDLHRVLHVRSFLDHDRPYKQPEDRKAAERRPQTGGNVYIDSTGRLIPPGEMVQSTVEHLKGWSQIVNEHGLVLLEVHCLPPEVTARYRDESENLHFDVYHALSHQFLLDAQTFLSCAAEAGLFRREGGGAGFPKHLPYTRISLSHFERRPYVVRGALPEDLPALAQLQEVWPQRRSRDAAVGGEFLLEIEGGLVASVRCEERDGTIRLTSARSRAGARGSHLRDLLQVVEQYWSLSDACRIDGIEECRSALAATDDEMSVVRAVARDVQARVAAYPFAAEDDPREAERELGTFSFRWLLAKLQQLGVMRDAGEAYDFDEIVRRLAVAPKYRRYFDALMRRLQDEGLVTMHGRRIETTPLVREYALTSVEQQAAEFRERFQQRFPAQAGLLNLTARCLERFDEIVTGRIDITEVVFEGANMDVFTEIFRGGVVSDYFNRIAADAVRDTVVRLQATTPKIRILEIGAGTGATTTAILEALQSFSGSVELCFSDISQSFIRNARRRFAGSPISIDYRLLNIEEDLSRQGFEAHGFDIVVAANVLHDTRNVDLALKQVRRLLKPGGLLVLDEYTSFKDCLFFSGALLHGYWLFQDPEKRLRDSCLLGVPQWISALERTGFAVAAAHALPTQSLDAACSQSVMLCEALRVDDAEEPTSHGQAPTAETIAALIEQQALALLGEQRAFAYSAQRPVMDMGLDSLELVELKSLIERQLGVKLTPMFLFEHETPQKMASALSEMVLVAPASAGKNTSSRKAEIIAALVEQQTLALLGEQRAFAYSAQRPVMDMGLDSLELVELKSLMERGLGVKLTPMFLFEHETPEKLAAALSEMVSDQQVERLLPSASGGEAGNGHQPAVVETAEAVVSARENEDAVAIVGVACRFPGGAVSAEKFWRLMESGGHGIVSMPAARWRWPAFIDLGGKHKGVDKAGFLERIDEFDAPFFRTSPKEANLMDPQQRLLLELSWEAMEDGGHRPSELSGRKIGVFVGVCHYDYREVLTAAVGPVDAYVGTGSALSLLANRLSYFYDFKGPSLTVDTACSSSLFALHHALNAIRSGDCEQVLVGAANLLCSPTNSISYYRAGMLSPTGTCRTFDATADGYVRGEGGAMLLLKPLAMALADGDSIYGLVKGTAVNHGGQAASLTAPKPEAQAAVIEAAWQAADVALESIGYIEAHGTGTRLGDPVEVGGLIEAFGRLYRSRGVAWPGKHPCGLGSVKTNIGHLEGAAGLAGLIKVLMAIQHRSIPATLNLEQLNPDIDLADSPFHVVAHNEVWPAGRDGEGRELPRCAGVSSFGFGGSNAHAVIEEYPSFRNEAEAEDGQYLIPLSARNDERLAEQAKRLLEFLVSAMSGDPASGPRLADVAYTLQVGRESMEERVAFVVRSREELTAALHTYIAGNWTFLHCYRGHAELRRARTPHTDERRAEIEASIASRDLPKLASLWVNGVELEWTRLSMAGRARRAHVPTYPFARERYWVETARDVAGERASSVPTTGVIHPWMHPLLHTNSSTLSRQSFSATFSGDEFFLSDHQVRVDGRPVQKVLPGVAYLEMARAAIEAALPARPESTILELRNTVWVQPIVVTGPKQVSIALLANDDDQIDFELYTQDAENEIVHCQGQAVLSQRPPPAALDIEQLERRMGKDRLEPAGVYAACARQGLVYGPAFQGVTAIDRGSSQLLARLRLPRTVEDTSEDYVLHPSLMDSALQAAVLLLDSEGESSRPRLPFALESLRIVSPCTREMVVWVRHAPGSQAGGNVTRLDIDLCDERGNVCAEMRGLSLRVPSKEADAAGLHAAAAECLLATPVWQASGVQGAGVEHAEHHVVLCELSKVDVEKLQSLLPQSECLSLRSEPGKTIAQRYNEYALASFERIRTILREKPPGKVLVQIVAADHQEQALFAGLSGLLKTAALENPQLIGQVILTGSRTTADELASHLRDEKTHGLDPLVKYEDGARQVLCWQEVPYDADQQSVELKDDGVYLITGGLGGLGVLFAREILEHTRHARVILTGRSELSAESQAVLDGLSPRAGRVSYRQGDVGDLDDVRRLIVATREEYGRLNGILHGAGVIADDFILRKDSAQFTEVLAPKVTGTYNLDQASQDVELDVFVLFSSIAGALGNVGQADYAAANGFMDHFAAYRNRQVAAGRRHGRTRSVNWPLWQSGGMSIDGASLDMLQRTTGMQPMQTAAGMHAFHRCLALPYDRILVMAGDPAQIRRALLGGPVLQAEPHGERPAAAGLEDEILAEKTQRYLRRKLAGVLELPSHRIDPRAALREYGIDSILAMQLLNELEQTFGTLPKTLFFEYQTIRELADYFGTHHSKELNALFAATANRTSETTTVAAPVGSLRSKTPVSGRRFLHARNAGPRPAAESEPIAIIGLSGRYPEAVDIDAYWNNLREGKDCIVEVPRERWDWRKYFSEDRNSSGRHYSKWGGFITGVDEFDPLFFNISPREAKYIDPQERLFLQHAWMAVEDAGYTRATLQVPHEGDLAGQVGVYVGVMWSEYHPFDADAGGDDSRMGFAGNVASIANRVSYVLNLHGPSVTLDTMCSSSLSAIHFACQDLRLGRTSMAIAGGVNVSVHPNKYLMLSVGQFISSDGHCQSFGEGGDGYIPGEGVGAVVLKRLSDAERDGDHVYGIIRGSALNHGGRTNGYTVPNPQAQASAITRALAESHTDARQISYVEAHGTGTKLGDPIEIAALSKAFGPYTQDTQFCMIGSAKSNIGHCESAAGIAGLTKVLLQMQHQQIVPSLHSEQLNPNIDFPGSAFVVNQSLRPWEQPVIDGRTLPRIAGISSFGAGGSNAHMIVEEYPAPVQQPVAIGNVIVPLSARTAEQLHEAARDLLKFVRARRNTINVVSMAYTLQVGREAMEERLCFAVGSVGQLVEKLQAYVAGDVDIEDAYYGEVRRNREALSLFSADDLQQTVDRWIANGQLAKLAELWARGMDLDWTRLYREAIPRRISLPTYPFAKERYWIDVAASRQGPTAAVLHPLLHGNTSDLLEQRYGSTFTGEEFFLAEHQVTGQKVLPGVAYLEMARAAIEHAAARPESTVLELRDIVWTQPIVVKDATQVSIALSTSDNDEIDYEIYSGLETVHCQGRAVFSHRSAPSMLDLGQLDGQMSEGRVEPESVYAACARMGLVYGPAFRGVTAIQRGNRQLLAHLRLPSCVAEEPAHYVLHPSLMDSALQASVGLIDDPSELRLPFALKSLRLASPCTAEMVAWVRYAGDKAVELDIDLCDLRGNVCVEMRGLSLRAQSRETGTGSLLAIPVWMASEEDTAARLEFAETYVLSLQVEQHETIARRYSRHALACFEQIRAILQSKRQGQVLLQVVVTDELLVGLSGLLKTAALENPQFVGQLILVPAGMTAEEVGRNLEEEKRGRLDPLVRYERGARQVLRWQDEAAEAEKPPIAFSDRGVYLISGGRGGLGTLFAKEILEQTRDARVILTGRSPSSAVESKDRMSYRQVDLGDLDQVERLIAGIKAEYGQLNGILHSAGMTADHFILQKTVAEFSEVLAPKVAGTLNLDHASRDVELDFFVLFSSFAGALGNSGQADYAAANGFMDQFAAYRNLQVASGQRYGRTRSINWPLWQAGGMSIDRASLDMLQRTTGMQPMQTATGLQAFHRSLALPYDQILVAEGDLAQLRRTLAASRPVVPERAPLQPAVDGAELDSGSLMEKTHHYFQRQFSDLLKVPAHRIDPRAALEEYGIDSVLALQLINRLEQTFGPLSKTLIFEYRTVRDLSKYFVDHHSARLTALFAPSAAPSGAPPQVPVPKKPMTSRRFGRPRAAAPSPATESDGIAIIGLSGRYPEAFDIDAYWKNLRDGKDCIVEVPKERWDWREYFSDDRTASGHHYSKWGGFIEGVAEFDPLFFNISPKEAKFIDPQERLFLQHAWMAVEDAGYTRASLQRPCENDLAGQVGVYAGVMWGEYQLFGAEASAQGRRLGIAGSTASIANRVSYALDLHGPSMTLDTMCSSSLTAIHIACHDLKQGRCSLAIAGGVNVSIHPNKYLVLSAGQFISGDGHCQSFGEGGDGYIPGEGVGAVVLKRLAEAERDGDHIYGIIRGSALNHGGKTNGYTVPNPQAQANAVSRALAESRTDARHISYIEAHGTGTKLGDPIEIAALSSAFGQYTRDAAFCLIGSAKSNIGHCESAAGIAGLTKVLLQMQHREIVPSLHSARLNPYIDFESSPFVVNQILTPWEPPVIDGRTLPRIAGLSSFGAGGSNAHMIVEEYQAPVRPPVAVGDAVIVLSTRTAEQLQQKARDLLEFVRTRRNAIDLTSLAYTLQVGREPMEERLGFVVGSVAQLVEKLQAYVAGEQAIDNAYHGQVKRNRETLSVFSADPDLQQTVDKWIAKRKLSRLLELWVKGLELDWSRLYGEVRPRRISLPAYPFARERHWIDPVAGRSSNGPSTAVLHPLLHSNTSDLTAQRYRSTFTGEELFIAERAGRKVLPAVACLEMARAAFERAVPAQPEATVLELHDTVWSQPIIVGENRQVSIELFTRDNGEIGYEIYSQDAEQEIVHCQGRAASSREAAPARLDIEQLKRQGQRVVQLRLPGTVGDYVLHPTVLDGALRAVGGSSESSSPRALELLRVYSPCSPDMVAWVRYTLGGGADIDLCDGQGNVAVQMRGMSWQEASVEGVETVAEQAPSPTVSPVLVHQEITFLAAASVERRKPAPIALAAPGMKLSAASSAGRSRITLSNAARGGPATSAVSPVRLYDCGDGIFSIEIAASRSTDVIAHFLEALERARQEVPLKVLMLSGIEHCFVSGGREEYNEAVHRKLFQRLVAFPYPVIACLQGDVIGTGFLAAALCDFMVCNDDARYGYTDAEYGFYPTTAEAVLFSARFGEVRTEDFLYGSTDSTGRQLRTGGWACPVVPWTQVEAHAQQLAATLATKSQEALRLLKAHLTRHLAGPVDALTRVDVAEAATEDASHEVAVIHYGHAGVRDQGTDLPRYKAIVLVGEDPDVPDDVVFDLQRLILESPVPVVAALAGDAKGNGWLISQFCDARVYSKTGVYNSANIGLPFTQSAVAAFAHRFGHDAAGEILLTGADYSGLELQQRAGSLSVAEHDHVLSAAQHLAASWAKLPRATLAAWKKHNVATLLSRIHRLPAGAVSQQTDETPVAAPTSIPLQSGVINATAHPDGIVVVRMEDREAKNMFSDALVNGLREVFAHIEQMPAYKVVILTGYDNYFASGGTKESLLSIQEGKTRFTDSGIFHVALECKLPVIAAMQGHGIGAGWSMGMFADIVLLSDESRYVSPYMNYGFAPGAGATYSLTDKLGPDLARESLLTAQQYAGRELKKRGLTLRVLPRADVVTVAMILARQVARASRSRLTDLKRYLTAHVHQPLDETYRRELAMHEKTFVGRSDTLALIQNSFHQDIETPSVPQQTAPVQFSKPSVVNDTRSSVAATLRTLLANELLLQESDVDENAQFIDLGLDSITGVTWIRKINEKYQTTIEATKVYSHPTLAQLSRYIMEEAEKAGTLSIAAAPPVQTPGLATPWKAEALPPHSRTLLSRRSRTTSRFDSSIPATRASQPVAVIGMSGQFPQARNLEEFWQNIAQGKNCITQVERWDLNTYYQPGDTVAGKTNSRWMGALDEYDRFDPLFFNISPIEAESMDPQQRLFLQACWHAIENGGHDARRLSGSKCGVFVGCGTADYHQLSREQSLSAQGFTGSSMSILASRISYFLNLRGPSISIDTACSSSLVALANACDSLNTGGSDLALAGGVYVMAGPEMHIKTAQAGMLSAEGRCFSFDQRADGFVPGEGVGVVLLKRLADAERDGDIIHGVIQGWGVNQDGKTNGITAPNPESQTRLEQDVYDQYQIDPAEIQLIEAHGTGTKLGDPIEVEGLRNGFSKYTQKRDYCALGSVKSNIGHCLTAAGIAGLLKLVLALKHRQLPPTVNFERLNEHIDLQDSPFYINTRLQEWKLDGATKRQAAVSSFGFSGTNAHVVVGEYVPPAEAPRPVSPISIVPLSARTPDQLEQRARDLLELIRKEGPSMDLGEIAYTLQVGRAAMDERLGFVVSSVEQLAEKLQAHLDGRQNIEDAHQGQVKRNKESISIISQDDVMKDAILEKLMAQRNLSKLLSLWVKGLELDWTRLYGESRPRRVSLPVYPFAKERYWTDTAPGSGRPAAGLHPLLHRNTSDLNEQRYSSTFTGDEFFLTDHRVLTDGRGVQKVLPGVACLEMARAAIRQTWPMELESRLLELHDTVWLKPVVVERPEEVSIALSAADDDRIDYEIYSARDGHSTVHCQGQAAFGAKFAPARLDLAQLRGQMRQGRLEASDVYAMFDAMGLHYGPAHQGIKTILLGDRQLLAELRLPAVVEANQREYELHPSLMDSALQASIGLISDPKRGPGKPAVPFALESIRIVSACTKEMVAWVCYAEGSKPADLELDIDLCDGEGNVCVQMRGFALRAVGGETKPIHDGPGLPLKEDSSFDEDFYARLVADVVTGQMSVDDAAAVG
jgi:polyketide synthase PksN